MTTAAPETLDLQRAAREHLWLHFTRMSAYEGADVPIIVRGDGCYLEDAGGKRYLDALAGLFSVNIGYGYGEEIGEAAAAQMRELPFYTNWGYAHPRAIELASEIASLAPGDLNRVFFVSGGSEAVESAWKLARQYYTARGEQRVRAAIVPMGGEVPTRVDEAHAVRIERRWKAVSRRLAYHGTTMGALSINGIPALRMPFEPLVPDVVHVHNTNRYHRPPDGGMEPFMQDSRMYSHGITFGGHPVQAAVALKNIEIMRRERIVEHVAAKQDAFRKTLAELLELPIVGDLRGTGFFYALELVKDKETRETFTDEECETLLRGFLSPRLFEKGLICRADDRGDPVIQISPPLVAGQR